MKKYAIRIVSVMLMLAVLATAAFAQNDTFFRANNLIYNAETRRASVDMYVNTLHGVSASDFKVALNETELAVEQLNAASANGETWIYLVDTTKVSTSSGNAPVTGLLEELIDGLQSGDNAAIIATGFTERDIELTTRTDRLKSDIKAKWLTPNDKNDDFSETLWQTMNYLQNASDVNPRKNVVVISDGDYSGRDGELLDRISHSAVTVHTVAFYDSNSVSSTFRALAENSYGGVAVAEEARKGSDESAYQQIQDVGNCFYNLTMLVPEDVNPNGTLTITLNRSASQYVQSFQLVGPDESGSAESTDGADAENNDGQENNAEGNEGENGEDTETTFWEKATGFIQNNAVILTAAVAAVAIIVILLIQLLKKPNHTDNSDDNGPPDDPTPNRRDEDPNVTKPDNDFGSKVTITLQPVSGQGSSYTKTMYKERILIGRVGGNADISIETDDIKMSREHLFLTYVNQSMYVEDCSKNGTLLNNVPIKRPTMLHQRDILTIGRSEYQITWWARH